MMRIAMIKILTPLKNRVLRVNFRPKPIMQIMECLVFKEN